MGRGEKAVQRAPVAKKVLVIGGGPGGLEAARVAADRGHNVTLMEKEAVLGGAFAIASRVISKEILISFIDWEERQCRKLGVKIELNKAVTPKVLEEFKPDVVIVATGSTPFKPQIPGINKRQVVTAADVLSGKASVGRKVVVAGGEMVGVEVADFIIEKGLAQDVTLLDRGGMSSIAEGMPALDKAYFMVNVVPKIGLKIITDMQVEEITDRSVVAIDKKWQKHEFEANTVVLALGYISDKTIFEALKDKFPELYIIGDAVNPRNALSAVHEGAYFAEEI
jgi:2-enoate reductase